MPASERTLDPSEIVVRIDQPLSAALQHVEQTMVQTVMAKAKSVDEAARILGLSRYGLYLKRLRFGMAIDKPRGDTFDSLRSKGIVIAGSPTTVVQQIKEWHKRGIGHLLMMNHAGSLSTELTRRSMKLFADEVYPEVRELRSEGERDGATPSAEPAPAVQERVMRAEG